MTVSTTKRNAPGSYEITAIKSGTKFNVYIGDDGWWLSAQDYDIGGEYLEKTLKEAKRMIDIIIIEGEL